MSANNSNNQKASLFVIKTAADQQIGGELQIKVRTRKAGYEVPPEPQVLKRSRRKPKPVVKFKEWMVQIKAGNTETTVYADSFQEALDIFRENNLPLQ